MLSAQTWPVKGGEAAEGTPVAIVRGATYDPDDTDRGIGEILRPLDKDLFR